ncbi:MAG: hypothetical protein ABI557_13395, partial [Aureliella sp.]
MLISKRRLRWTAIGLLIVCVSLMLRPTRSWFERAWIALALNPRISVGELVVHSHKSIIEARDLTWRVDSSIAADATSEALSRRTFGVNARRCWFAIDRDSLPSGKLHVPKVILQDADLYLSRGSLSADNSLKDWRQQMARQIVDFDWGAVQRQLSCLPATEELRTTWHGLVESWIDRSHEILFEAAQLVHQVEAMDNPLRFEESI